MLVNYSNLTIRNATTADAEQLALWWSDGKVMAHAGFPNGLGQSAQSIADNLKGDRDDVHRRLILEINQVPVGEMSYSNLGDGVAEIGIKICDFSAQNKGSGKLFLSMLIRTLYNDLGFTKIILDTNLNNHRAQHVYEQLGFRKVRIRENAWTNQVGELQSSVDYELSPQGFRDCTK
ncbi:MAG: GNAT family protein [Eubacteriales bacterium]|nr:GNAT family protein [Eubacteriales bacterium]